MAAMLGPTLFRGDFSTYMHHLSSFDALSFFGMGALILVVKGPVLCLLQSPFYEPLVGCCTGYCAVLRQACPMVPRRMH